MNDQILMRVLNRRTDLTKEFETFVRRELMLIAIPRNASALDVLHNEKGQSILSRAAVKQSSNIRVFADFPWLLSPAAAMFFVVLGVNLVLQNGARGVKSIL